VIATLTAQPWRPMNKHRGCWSKTRAIHTTLTETATAWRARNCAEGVMKLLVLTFGSFGQVLHFGPNSGVFLSYAPGFFLTALFDKCIVSVHQLLPAVG
jgi:hypothetical protein